MNYTDDQLKQLLAKMLPETIAKHACGKYYWIGSANGFILDTERLHLCSLVESGLTEDEWSTYSIALNKLACRVPCGNLKTCGYTIAATWQQRTAALAEVKGATL
jgi:hypothetical protein